MSDTCAGCRFWAGRADWEVAACKRHAPIGIAKLPTYMNGYAQRKWPTTQGSEWCGDFEPLKKEEPCSPTS